MSGNHPINFTRSHTKTISKTKTVVIFVTLHRSTPTPAPKNVWPSAILLHISYTNDSVNPKCIVTKGLHINTNILSWIQGVYICHYFVLQFCCLVNKNYGFEAKPN